MQIETRVIASCWATGCFGQRVWFLMISWPLADGAMSESVPIVENSIHITNREMERVTGRCTVATQLIAM